MHFTTFFLAASTLGVAKAFEIQTRPVGLAFFAPTASLNTSPCMETSPPSLASDDPDITTIFTTTTLLGSVPLNHATKTRLTTLTDSDMTVTVSFNRANLPRPTTLIDSKSTPSFTRASMSQSPQPAQTSLPKPTTIAALPLETYDTSETADEEGHEDPWAHGFKKNLPAFIAGMIIIVFSILLVLYLVIRSRLPRAEPIPEAELEAQRG